MGSRADIADRHSGIYFDRNSDILTRSRSRSQDRRVNAIGISRISGNIARAYDCGKHKFVIAADKFQTLGIANPNFNFFSRFDISQRLSKNIIAFLFQQTSSPAFLSGSLVNFHSLIASFDISFNSAIAYFNFHVIHRRFIGQRKYINSF